MFNGVPDALQVHRDELKGIWLLDIPSIASQSTLAIAEWDQSGLIISKSEVNIDIVMARIKTSSPSSVIGRTAAKDRNV